MAGKIAIIWSFLNPIFWIIDLFTGMHAIKYGSTNVFTMAMGGAIWGIISYFMAEYQSQKRGYLILWYLAFLVFGIITVIWTLFVDEFLTRRNIRRKIAADRIANSTPSLSDIVAGAVKVYSPKQIKEFGIQDLVDNHEYDRAISRVRIKLEFSEEEHDRENVKKYSALLKYIEHSRQVHRDELLEKDYQDRSI